MRSLEDLSDWFGGRGRALVALSGGVDSALVALAAHERLGPDAVAVTADYKTLSRDELTAAKTTCSEIGIEHVLIEYDELDNEDFARNDRRRCFYCRTELAARLLALAARRGIGTIADGTHLDDLGDYRPGIGALRQNGICSPLAELGFTKADVRREAECAGLSACDRPSNSCLASRIPWGQRVTAESLARIELGETFVRNRTRARQIRVRDMDGVARIEVDPEHVRAASDASGELDSQLRMIGFKSVVIDPDGYAPGKANVVAD